MVATVRRRLKLISNEEPAGMTVGSIDIIAVGTTNACKVAAVDAAVRGYEVSGANFLDFAAIETHQVSSEVSAQPMTLDETYRGAMNRARNAYAQARAGNSSAVILALGIESGLNWSTVDGRAYDVCVCSAFDGTTFNQGMSCSFEIPPLVLRFVLEEGMDLAQASNAAGVSSNPKLGEAEGLIGILSRGRITRLDYTKQAIEMALMFLDSASLYARPATALPNAVKSTTETASRLATDSLATPLRRLARSKSFSATPTERSALSEASRLDADRRDCIARLCSALRGRCGVPFELPVASLLAVFGAAFGESGPSSNCRDCSHRVDSGGRRTVVVEGRDAVDAFLADSPIAASIGKFILAHDGVSSAQLQVDRAKGQSCLASSL
ncbi:unnamed protein product, partial [Polarella glacialis]